MKPPARNLPILRGSNLLLGAEPAHQPARRRFVRDLALGGLAIGSLGLSACGGDDDEDEGEPVASVTYAHGVASGDPLSDRVILWTRLSTVANICTSPCAGRCPPMRPSPARGQRQHVSTGGQPTGHVKGRRHRPQPGTRYWYRFAVRDQRSPVGRTRTLPGAAVAQVKLAVFSCSNYPAGYFNVYAEAANATTSTPRSTSATTSTSTPRRLRLGAGRRAGPRGAAGQRDLTLATTGSRYAQYRSDPDLQALHARTPMIAMWDDHEIANDTWRNGAENHTEGGGTGGEGELHRPPGRRGAGLARVAAGAQRCLR
jgi:alkaline phosphatase D